MQRHAADAAMAWTERATVLTPAVLESRGERPCAGGEGLERTGSTTTSWLDAVDGEHRGSPAARRREYNSAPQSMRSMVVTGRAYEVTSSVATEQRGRSAAGVYHGRTDSTRALAPHQLMRTHGWASLALLRQQPDDALQASLVSMPSLPVVPSVQTRLRCRTANLRARSTPAYAMRPHPPRPARHITAAVYNAIAARFARRCRPHDRGRLGCTYAVPGRSSEGTAQPNPPQQHHCALAANCTELAAAPTTWIARRLRWPSALELRRCPRSAHD